MIKERILDKNDPLLHVLNVAKVIDSNILKDFCKTNHWVLITKHGRIIGYIDLSDLALKGMEAFDAEY